jgi:hypothetical protein
VYEIDGQLKVNRSSAVVDLKNVKGIENAFGQCK